MYSSRAFLASLFSFSDRSLACRSSSISRSLWMSESDRDVGWDFVTESGVFLVVLAFFLAGFSASAGASAGASAAHP